MTAPRPGQSADDDATLAPRERALLEESVRPVAGRSVRATITIALVVAAFLVGLVHPWDWLAGASRSPVAGDRATGQAPGSGGPGQGGNGQGGIATPAPTDTPAPGSDAAAAAVCAYPQSWRSATIQDWAGRRARVWTAVDVVTASGPLDSSIPFQVVAGDRFTAIGWCAPVLGPDRPPLTMRGVLFRVDAGAATPEPYRLLEPAAPNALGELWAPTGSATWPAGRYVIELATPSGSWVRWLGLELRVSPVLVATPSPVPSPAGSPDASTSPSSSPATSAP